MEEKDLLMSERELVKTLLADGATRQDFEAFCAKARLRAKNAYGAEPLQAYYAVKTLVDKLNHLMRQSGRCDGY